jgi:serine/threonine protein phosphatase PrpC
MATTPNSTENPTPKLLLEIFLEVDSEGNANIKSVVNANPQGEASSSVPKKKSSSGIGLRFAISEQQGPRETMEDAHYADSDTGLFCVFDGHGGRKAADFAASRFPELLSNHPEYPADLAKALRDAVVSTEDEFMELARKDELNDGTTLVVGLVAGNKLYVANVGDSEALICREDKPIVLTTIHNPSKNPKEGVRVQNAGGRLINNRVGHPHYNVRLFNIAVSRAIGDLLYKSPEFTLNKTSGLIAEPDISVTELTSQDKFLLLACDGVWDVFTHAEAVDFILEKLEETQDPQALTDALVHEALARRSLDNVTACIVLFTHP